MARRGKWKPDGNIPFSGFNRQKLRHASAEKETTPQYCVPNALQMQMMFSNDLRIQLRLVQSKNQNPQQKSCKSQDVEENILLQKIHLMRERKVDFVINYR